MAAASSSSSFPNPSYLIDINSYIELSNPEFNSNRKSYNIDHFKKFNLTKNNSFQFNGLIPLYLENKPIDFISNQLKLIDISSAFINNNWSKFKLGYTNTNNSLIYNSTIVSLLNSLDVVNLLQFDTNLILIYDSFLKALTFYYSNLGDNTTSNDSILIYKVLFPLDDIVNSHLNNISNFQNNIFKFSRLSLDLKKQPSLSYLSLTRDDLDDLYYQNLSSFVSIPSLNWSSLGIDFTPDNQFSHLPPFNSQNHLTNFTFLGDSSSLKDLQIIISNNFSKNNSPIHQNPFFDFPLTPSPSPNSSKYKSNTLDISYLPSDLLNEKLLINHNDDSNYTQPNFFRRNVLLFKNTDYYLISTF
ncbi:uncharacterized protein ASCRUDRAFT_14623 [Ascoidea rubescens DSM 1968]|uniref:Uncharacterized protein n=1 Tax=Ascoidea rubescens DSM 1968 TaxID=1344418 RepID=A0A1D2VD02_9ASCO|nr:hypothetical protein ASCRUDRAFT_14623 [Ascoidea rubescens DSM 1968]ODV59578.1 hypothetical protein ASCRUDRAFT_14623 [Ascoidea rubescens DSM 1968]